MSARFDVLDTPLAGLRVLERHPIGDARGYLERLYCAAELSALLGDRRIVQVNHTLTRKRGTVRGLHFQRAPHAETKLVTCLRGEVYDVAVDVREDSPTFLSSHAVRLDPDNFRTFLIPEGFAHGFQALTDDCELLYFHTEAHHPESEAGLDARDPALAIAWPMPITERSPRDEAHPRASEFFRGVAR